MDLQKISRKDLKQIRQAHKRLGELMGKVDAEGVKLAHERLNTEFAALGGLKVPKAAPDAFTWRFRLLASSSISQVPK